MKIPRFLQFEKYEVIDLKEFLSDKRIEIHLKRNHESRWLVVQHADQDSVFQEEILKILTSLWPIKETNPANYAYLYDRVAASYSDPSKRKLQRYGTQGLCAGPGIWEPLPMEDPNHIDEIRKTVGLGTMEIYKKKIQRYLSLNYLVLELLK